jgi:hypothetical protein
MFRCSMQGSAHSMRRRPWPHACLIACLGGQRFCIVARTPPSLFVFGAVGPTAGCWRFTFRRLLPPRLKHSSLQGIGILYVRMLALPRLPCLPSAVASLPAGRLSPLSLSLLFVLSHGYSGEGIYMWSGFQLFGVGGCGFPPFGGGTFFGYPALCSLRLA